MSSFEETFPENFDIEKAIREILDAPEWEGFAIPYPEKLRRYVAAAQIIRNLFPDAENVEKVFTVPKPFHADCGGEINVFCDISQFSFAVFKNRATVEAVSKFLSLIDSLSITAEKSMTGEPVLVICWDILDVFQK